jgi:hypothetical protein
MVVTKKPKHNRSTIFFICILIINIIFRELNIVLVQQQGLAYDAE